MNVNALSHESFCGGQTKFKLCFTTIKFLSVSHHSYINTVAFPSAVCVKLMNAQLEKNKT